MMCTYIRVFLSVFSDVHSYQGCFQCYALACFRTQVGPKEYSACIRLLERTNRLHHAAQLWDFHQRKSAGAACLLVWNLIY